jgi:hypothetical protein
VTRSQAENWSTWRSLAFLAATFAIVIGSLMPFAALAASTPGQPIVICSADGPQTIQSGGVDGPIKEHMGAKCAACVMPLLAALPAPAAPEPAQFVVLAKSVFYTPSSPALRPRPAPRRARRRAPRLTPENQTHQRRAPA